MTHTRLLKQSDEPSLTNLLQKRVQEVLFLVGLVERYGIDYYQTFGAFEGETMTGVLMAVENLPPFGKPVLLPFGNSMSALLLHASRSLAIKPEIVLGPADIVEPILASWPDCWLPYLGRRDEILFCQPDVKDGSSSNQAIQIRRGNITDSHILAEFRIKMEQDSATTLVSTREEALATVESLIAQQAIWVAVENDKPLACTAITSETSTLAQFGFIYTDREARSRGVATLLLSSLCQKIHSEGKKPIVFTAPSSVTLIRCVERIGFVRIGTHHKLYFGVDTQ